MKPNDDAVANKRIRQTREGKGLNQAQLATAAGITPAAISQIEAGERTPSTPILRRIATVLGVSMDYLLGRTDKTDLDDLLQNESIQKFFRGYQSLSAADQRQIQQQIDFLKHKGGRSK